MSNQLGEKINSQKETSSYFDNLFQDAKKKFDETQQEIEKIYSETSESIVQGIKGSLYALGEYTKGEAVKEDIKGWNTYIENSAKDEEQANLMRAIVYEEQTHQVPLENFAEQNDIPNPLTGELTATIGPGQIHVNYWSETYETNREELKQPEKHFPVMAKHLDHIDEVIEEEDLPDTPEMAASIYNNEEARTVTKYGERVGEFYKNFSEDYSEPQNIEPPNFEEPEDNTPDYIGNPNTGPVMSPY